MNEPVDSFLSSLDDVDVDGKKRGSPTHGSDRPYKKKRRDAFVEKPVVDEVPVERPQRKSSFHALGSLAPFGLSDRLSSHTTKNSEMPSKSSERHHQRKSISFPYLFRASQDDTHQETHAGRRESHHQPLRRRLSQFFLSRDSGKKDGDSSMHKTIGADPVDTATGAKARSRKGSFNWGSRPSIQSPPTIDARYSPPPSLSLPERTSSLEQSMQYSSANLLAPLPGNNARQYAAYHMQQKRSRSSSRPLADRSFPTTPGNSSTNIEHPTVSKIPQRRQSSASLSFHRLASRNMRCSGSKVQDSDCESGIDMEEAPRTDPAKRKDPALLPQEIHLRILCHLDQSSIINSLRVSKAWHNLAISWDVKRELFLMRWQPRPLHAPLPAPVGGRGVGMDPASRPMQDWEKMYKARTALEANWRAGKQETSYLFSHTDSVYCVQFDERKAITGSRDQTIRIWDLHTKRCTRVIGSPNASEKDRRRNPTDHDLTPKMEHQIRDMGDDYYPPADVYHVPEYWHRASILCLQYDDEIMVTGSSDNTLIVWSMATLEPTRRLHRHTSGVLDLAFDAQKIVSCSKDFTICIWDRLTGRLLHQIEDHNGPVNAIQLRGDTIVSASGEGSSHLYRLNFQRPDPAGPATCTPESLRVFWSRDRGLACVEYSDDGRHVLAGGNDHLVFRYDTADTRSPHPIEQALSGHDGLVRSLYLDSANDRTISGSYDLSIKVWEFGRGRLLHSFVDKTTSWILSAKGDYRRVVGTSQDGRIVVLDFGKGVQDVGLLEGKVGGRMPGWGLDAEGSDSACSMMG